jgi:hypothetical protein
MNEDFKAAENLNKESESSTRNVPPVDHSAPRHTEFRPELTSLVDPFDFVFPAPEPAKVVKSNQKDYLSIIHAVVFNLASIYIFGCWLVYHSHDFFSDGAPEKDLWYKKMCRQLNHMAYSREDDFGKSSVFFFAGKAWEWWVLYITYEMVLFSIRMFLVWVFDI